MAPAAINPATATSARFIRPSPLPHMFARAYIIRDAGGERATSLDPDFARAASGLCLVRPTHESREQNP